MSLRAGDLHTTDLGGNGGMEPTACGNVLTSFWRRPSNSEYLQAVSTTRGLMEAAGASSVPLYDFDGTSLGWRVSRRRNTAACLAAGVLDLLTSSVSTVMFHTT